MDQQEPHELQEQMPNPAPEKEEPQAPINVEDWWTATAHLSIYVFLFADMGRQYWHPKVSLQVSHILLSFNIGGIDVTATNLCSSEWYKEQPHSEICCQVNRGKQSHLPGVIHYSYEFPHVPVCTYKGTGMYIPIFSRLNERYGIKANILLWIFILFISKLVNLEKTTVNKTELFCILDPKICNTEQENP